MASKIELRLVWGDVGRARYSRVTFRGRSMWAAAVAAMQYRLPFTRWQMLRRNGEWVNVTDSTNPCYLPDD